MVNLPLVLIGLSLSVLCVVSMPQSHNDKTYDRGRAKMWYDLGCLHERGKALEAEQKNLKSEHDDLTAGVFKIRLHEFRYTPFWTLYNKIIDGLTVKDGEPDLTGALKQKSVIRSIFDISKNLSDHHEDLCTALNKIKIETFTKTIKKAIPELQKDVDVFAQDVKDLQDNLEWFRIKLKENFDNCKNSDNIQTFAEAYNEFAIRTQCFNANVFDEYVELSLKIRSKEKYLKNYCDKLDSKDFDIEKLQFETLFTLVMAVIMGSERYLLKQFFEKNFSEAKFKVENWNVTTAVENVLISHGAIINDLNLLSEKVGTDYKDFVKVCIESLNEIDMKSIILSVLNNVDGKDILTNQEFVQLNNNKISLLTKIDDISETLKNVRNLACHNLDIMYKKQVSKAIEILQDYKNFLNGIAPTTIKVKTTSNYLKRFFLSSIVLKKSYNA